jgi:hypothetical protein
MRTGKIATVLVGSGVLTILLAWMVVELRAEEKKPAGPFPPPPALLGPVQENAFVPIAAAPGSKLQAVVVDGPGSPEIEGIGQGYPVNSFDGSKVGLVAGRGGKQYVVVNGQAGPEYDGILAGSLTICFNGATWAYTAKKGAGWVVVVNGKESPSYDGAGGAVITGDGSHVAYPARRGNKYFVIIDEKAGKEYDGVFAPLSFSMDGAHWAYIGMTSGKYCVVSDGKEGPQYDNITGLRYTNIYYPSPDNKLLYVGTRATQ